MFNDIVDYDQEQDIVDYDSPRAVSQDQMIPNSRLVETPREYQTPEVLQPTTQVVRPQTADTYNRDFVKSKKMQDTEALGELYERGYPNFETYRPLVDPMSGIAPGSVQTFLENATPEDRANFIKAINFDRDFGVIQGENQQRLEGMDEGLIPYQELDFLAAPLGKWTIAKAGPELIEAWRMRGLPSAVKRALQSGDKQTLERLIAEARQSKGLGIGDWIYKGKGQAVDEVELRDLSSNMVEQKYARDKFKNIGEEAIRPAKAVMGADIKSEGTADYLTKAIQDKYRQLKAPADAAYKKVLTGAGDERRFNTKVLNQKLRDYMLKEGATPTEVDAILKILQPSGRALTREQKAMVKELQGLEKRATQLQKALDSRPGSRAGNLTRQLNTVNRRMEALRNKVDIPEEYLSEQEALNIVSQLGDKLRQGSNYIKSPNADRILQNVRNQYMDEMEKMLELGGSNRMKDLRRANRLARQGYAYLETMPEVEILARGKGLPDEIMRNLMANPERLNEIIKTTKNPELGRRLADEMVSRITRPVTEARPGARETLDFGKTATQLENLFANKSTREFLEKNLGPDRFNQLKAFRNVSSRIGKLFDEMKQVPGSWEYITEGEGATGKLGRTLKVIYDYGGALKNRTISQVPGFKWTDTRIKASNKQIDKVLDIANKKLKEVQEGKLDIKDIASSLTKQEEEALDTATDMFGNWSKVLGKSQINKANKGE